MRIKKKIWRVGLQVRASEPRKRALEKESSTAPSPSQSRAFASSRHVYGGRRTDLKKLEEGEDEPACTIVFMIFIIICFHVFLSNIVSPFSRYRWRCDSCSDQNWNRMDPLEKKDFAYLLQQTRVSEVCRHAWQQSKSTEIGGPLWGESTKRMRQLARPWLSYPQCLPTLPNQ